MAFDSAPICGVLVTGLMLDAGTNDSMRDGLDEDLDGVAGFGTLLAGLLDAAKDGADERVVGVEGGSGTSTLVMKVL